MFFLANPRNQKHHVGRRFYSDKLSEYARQGKNTAIVGPKYAGKTTLLWEIKDKLDKHHDLLPVYIGLNRTSTPPENFSVELIGGISFWFLGAISQDYVKFQDISHLLSIKDRLGKNAADTVDFLSNELQKIKPDQKAMLQRAFGFADEISKKSGKKVVMLLDDFENIFDLNNFSQVRDVLSLIPLSSRNVSYLVASSGRVLLEKSLRNFAQERVYGLSQAETQELVGKIIGKADNKVADEIHAISEGIPFLVHAIANRYSETHDVKKSFLIEMTLKNSSVFLHLESMLNDYLYRARGEAMPKTVVKILAFLREPRLTEISRRIYRSAPVTKSLLERMMQADILVKRDNKYAFSEPILKKWIKLAYSGYEFNEIPSDEILKKAEEVLNEQ